MTDEQLANLRRLADRATTLPWRVATGDEAGDNWLVGFGRSTADNCTYFVTTDRVHASELQGDARSDAEFVATARTAVPKLLDALAAMTARAEAAEQAALVKGNEWAQGIQHATVFRERAEAAEAKLAAVPLDDIQRMQGCEAHTKRTEWAKIRVANWLLQQGRRGYPPERANITIDGETCPCCGDSDVYKDATGTWRQCGDCEYAWQPKQQEAQP